MWVNRFQGNTVSPSWPLFAKIANSAENLSYLRSCYGSKDRFTNLKLLQRTSMIRIDSEEPDKALLTLVAVEKQNPGAYDATDKVVITITPYRKELWYDPWTTIEVDYTDAVQRIIKVSKGKDYREWKNDDISFDEIANFIFEPQDIYSEFYRFFH